MLNSGRIRSLAPNALLFAVPERSTGASANSYLLGLEYQVATRANHYSTNFFLIHPTEFVATSDTSKFSTQQCIRNFNNAHANDGDCNYH